MPLLVDLEESVHENRPHGPLTGDATEPAWERLPGHGGVSVWSGV
jgi:hypothetical protein